MGSKVILSENLLTYQSCCTLSIVFLLLLILVNSCYQCSELHSLYRCVTALHGSFSLYFCNEISIKHVVCAYFSLNILGQDIHSWLGPNIPLAYLSALSWENSLSVSIFRPYQVFIFQIRSPSVLLPFLLS